MSPSPAAIQRILGSRAVGAILRPLMRGRATIFMLHRFNVPELGIEGHDPGILRHLLETLRKERIRVAGLEELFEELREGASMRERVVAFTIDDGYVDQATAGADAFAAYDCPVTTFVTSGFLDGSLWFWWDRIAHVFGTTRRRSIGVTLAGDPLLYEWEDGRGRARAQADFTDRCKAVPEDAKLDGIAALAAAAEVDVPADPPPAFAPMSWGDLRRCEQRGMRFGPHTVTHPVLSRTSDTQSRWELSMSWSRLQAEARHPTPIFCYPNGQLQDFGSREIDTLGAIGITGGVVGVIGYATPAAFAATPHAPYHVPRFAYEESVAGTMQLINGIERAKQMVNEWRNW